MDGQPEDVDSPGVAGHNIGSVLMTEVKVFIFTTIAPQMTAARTNQPLYPRVLYNITALVMCRTEDFVARSVMHTGSSFFRVQRERRTPRHMKKFGRPCSSRSWSRIARIPSISYSTANIFLTLTTSFLNPSYKTSLNPILFLFNVLLIVYLYPPFLCTN